MALKKQKLLILNVSYYYLAFTKVCYPELLMLSRDSGKTKSVRMLFSSLLIFAVPGISTLRLKTIAENIRESSIPSHRHSRAGGNPVFLVIVIPAQAGIQYSYAENIRESSIPSHRHSRAGGNPVFLVIVIPAQAGIQI